MSPQDDLEREQFLRNRGLASNLSPEIRRREFLKPLLAGAAQGTTFDFADELYGAGKSALSDMSYDQARDEARNWFNRQQAENPSAYMGGEVGGSILTSAIPGTGFASGGKLAATLGKNVLKGAALGGLQGIGASEGETAPEVLGDAATSAAIGGALGGAPDLLGGATRKVSSGLNAVKEKLLGKATRGGSSTERELFNITTGLDPKQYDAIVSNPNLIKEAEQDSLKKIADDFVETRYKPLRELGNRYYENAASKLRTEALPEFGAVKKETLFNELDDLANSKEFNVGGSGSKSIEDVKEAINKVFQKSDDYIPETSIEKLKNEVNSKIKNWNAITGDAGEQDMLKNIRGLLNSKVKMNPEFDAAMQPVREVSDVLSKVKKNYGLERKFLDTGESVISPTDTTLSRLQRVKESLADRNFREEELSGVEDLFQKLKAENNPMLSEITNKFQGYSPTERVRARQLWEATEAGAPAGSANVNMYSDIAKGVIGGGLGLAASEDPTTGALVGGSLGAGLGRFSDKYGRKIAKNILLRKHGRMVSNNPMTDIAQDRLNNSRFRDVLNNAMRRGPQAYAVTDYILSQKYPDYRQAKAEE
ncbi:hypothetical protein [Leptospira johnsonii]|uniref:Uncharacterized protein n=1 Tax=Leptospira johnsonii TaxID=1917820 RepID=A0A2P2D7S5_9LEPT|nr:hypothetical protein [Leptospira johnsonii]GBF40683.1 hypothetical protein LPTSP1_37010 [Leptospira johnsonii]